MEALSGEGKDMNLDEFVPQMESALAALPHDQRTVLLLHFYQGLTGPEIADRLGCAEGTIRSRIDRAMKVLRKKLARSDRDMSEDMITSGMAGAALILPVPYSMTLKLAAITKGEAVGGAVMEIMQETLRSFMWAKVKMAATVACAIVIVPVAITAVTVFGPSQKEAAGTTPIQPPAAAVQVEKIYEDHFDSTKLNDFWEKVEPAAQARVNPPDNKSALVLTVAGAEANKMTREDLMNEVNVVSRPIPRDSGVLVLLVADRKPKVASIVVSPSKTCSSRVHILDESGKNRIQMLAPEGEGAAVAKSQSGDKGEYLLSGIATSDSVRFYCFYPSGRMLCQQNQSKFWGKMDSSSKSLRLGLQLLVNDSTVRATWPVERVVVRRLSCLPEVEVDRVLKEMMAETLEKGK